MAEVNTGPLSVLGIDLGSEQTYRAVLRRPGCSPETLSDLLGRPVETINDELEALGHHRLVKVNDDCVFPESPEFALHRLLNQEARRLIQAEDALTAARVEVNSYVAEHLAGQRPDWNPVTIDEVPGSDIFDVMQTLMTTSTGEMLFLRPDQWMVPAGKLVDQAVTQAMQDGRGSRVIYPAAIIETSSDTVRRRAAAGERIRVLPSVPARMAVFGTEAAILPEALENSAGNPLLIRQRGIVAACVLLFEQLWSRAVTVPGLSLDHEGDLQRQLLEQLAQGVKDEQIARAMGLSLRTVRRRIATVMAELGVDTRFQAGMEAVRRGWL